MRAGELDRRVALQRRDQVVDATTRQPGEQWVTVATVWAAACPLRGARSADGAAVRAEDTVEIFVRYRADVDATWRVVLDGRTLFVSAVQEIGRREGLRLICAGRAEQSHEEPDA